MNVNFGELKFPATLDQDERWKELAFEQYRIQHGIKDSVRLGDLPLRAVSEVLDRAQRLKSKETGRCER
jgi:hypothetical protein